MSDYQSDQIKLINTSLIDPHPDNPRKNIGDVSDLAASIKANGLLSPLSVVPNGRRYRVIAGHRRLAACKQAGTGAVPCFVLDLDPLQQLEAMVTENTQREQLTTMEEADAIQGMLDLGATTASVAHRLGRSSDYVRDRAKAASIDNEVRATRDDFSQLTIGQLVAIARYDGQPDRQKKLAQAAGTSNFDYILRNIERDDHNQQWVESVVALLGEPDSGINLIPDPEKPYSDPEWCYLGCMFPSTGTPEEAIEKIREQNPAAVSIHTVSQQVYLWTRRDKTTIAKKEAQRAAEQAERDARRHALEEYVDSLAQSFTLHPAGSNPQFDLDFITRLCPNLPLHYHRIDMATIRDSFEAAGWDVRPEGETPTASAHRTGTCLDRDIRQYARIIRHLSEHPVRYVATKEAR